MKKIVFTFLLLFLLGGGVCAQTMQIHYKDGKIISVPLSDVEKITYNILPKEISKMDNEHDAIINGMVQLAAVSQQYYRKPQSLG